MVILLEGVLTVYSQRGVFKCEGQTPLWGCIKNPAFGDMSVYVACQSYRLSYVARERRIMKRKVPACSSRAVRSCQSRDVRRRVMTELIARVRYRSRTRCPRRVIAARTSARLCPDSVTIWGTCIDRKLRRCVV